MSANAMKKINQKEYLKKYLSGDKKKKKKDKKHKLKNATKVRIIDDDAATAPQPDIDEELLLTGEDAPQIVATYIEENPKGEEKKWKSIAVKEEPMDDVKPTIKVEEDLWGPKATDRRYRDEFSPPNRKSAILPLPDLVPQIKSIKVERESSREWHRRSISGERKKERDSSTSEKKKLKRSSRSKKTERNSNEFDKRSANSRSEMSPASDQSPPRRRRQGGSADQSPRRQRRKDSSADHSPSYRKSKPSVNSALGRKRRDDSSDQNPFRRKPVSSVDQSSPQRERDSSDQSPPRRRRRDRSEDQSPPRRRRRDSSADQSPQRRGKDGSSDQSPPRRKRNKSDSNLQHRQRISRSAHRSPQHRARERTPSELKAHGRIKMEKPSPDLSPKRRHNSSRENNFRNFKREISPPQESPERKMRRSPDRSSSRREKREAAHSTSPPPTHKPTAATKTLDGKRAGLQDAQSLRQELQELRRREEEMFAKLPAELSGRDAEVQVRDYGRRGKKAREAQQIDPEEQLRKEAHEKKKKELYDRWGKGLKQIEAHRAKVEDDMYEGSKPLARYSNDADLERRLREQERIDDPMLEYMRKKRRQEQKQADVPTIPIYQGSYPENRFGIRPGYRWDGVDRSNGYEQKWFAKQSEKRAVEEEAYKYSVEDM